jgi:hypothetical protein
MLGRMVTTLLGTAHPKEICAKEILASETELLQEAIDFKFIAVHELLRWAQKQIN